VLTGFSKRFRSFIIRLGQPTSRRVTSEIMNSSMVPWYFLMTVLFAFH
jgi:hypothetical protein